MSGSSFRACPSARGADLVDRGGIQPLQAAIRQRGDVFCRYRDGLIEPAPRDGRREGLDKALGAIVAELWPMEHAPEDDLLLLAAEVG